jgi:rod shape-determining protein MreD
MFSGHEWWQAVFPVASTLVLALLAGGETFSLLFTGAPPTLGLCAFLYWLWKNPKRLPLLAVFLLGLILDTLSGTLLGLQALLLVLLRLRRNFLPDILPARSFMNRWGRAGMIITVYHFILWLCSGALQDSIVYCVMQTVLTILVLPSVWRLLLATEQPYRTVFRR